MSKVIKLHSRVGGIRLLRKQVHAKDTGTVNIPNEEDRKPAVDDSEPAHACDCDGAEFQQRIRDEFKAGFDEGRRFTEKALRDELARERVEQQQKVRSVIASVVEQEKKFRQSAEESLVKLSLAIAERIVKREVRLDPSVVLRQIHEATKRVVGVERIKLRVHPTEEEFVRQHRVDITSGSDAVRELVIEGDETISPGGCILESESGNVDALISTQMEKIEQALLGEQHSST